MQGDMPLRRLYVNCVTIYNLKKRAGHLLPRRQELAVTWENNYRVIFVLNKRGNIYEGIYRG